MKADNVANVLESLKALINRGHHDQLATLSVANQAAMNDRRQHSMNRMDAQVDALLKSKCPDHYTPPAANDDVGTFLNNGIIANTEFLEALLSNNENNSTQMAGEESSQPSVPSQDGAGTAGRGVSSEVRPSAGRADPGTGRSNTPTERPARPVGISGKLDGLLDRVPKWLKLLAGIAAAGGFLWWNEARRPTHAVLTGNELFEVIESEVTTVEGELDVRQ